MLINNIKLVYKKPLRICLCAAVVLILSGNIVANAEPHSLDVFSVNTHNISPTKKVTASASSSSSHGATNNAAVVSWFAKYDQIRREYSPSEKDKVIITRPLMQQAERVQQWTNTAGKVAKSYFQVAKLLRSLTVPQGMTDIKEYRDLVADWYQDAGTVYYDLIRPRPAAKTIEDLQDQLDAVKKRSEGLANNITNLKNMDRDLRQHYNVQPALQDDAIQQFIRSK